VFGSAFSAYRVTRLLCVATIGVTRLLCVATIGVTMSDIVMWGTNSLALSPQANYTD
jgi:hypothetical protein